MKKTITKTVSPEEKERKEKRAKAWEIFINFLGNVIAIVLGVVITFMIQDRIDRAIDRKDVRTGLELVRKELSANIEDIRVMSDYLAQEKKSAEYLLAHRTDLKKCPADSVDYHSSLVFADANITLSRDALDLLTMTSLFQKIGDVDLSMKIIRAYDAGQWAAETMNQHVSVRDARFEGSVNERTVGQYASRGHIDIAEYLKSGYGFYVVRWITFQTDILASQDNISDIEAALSAIDAYLEKN